MNLLEIKFRLCRAENFGSDVRVNYHYHVTKCDFNLYEDVNILTKWIFSSNFCRENQSVAIKKRRFIGATKFFEENRSWKQFLPHLKPVSEI